MLKMLQVRSLGCAVTCGIKAPKVLVLSRKGELCGICNDRVRKVGGGCVQKRRCGRESGGKLYHVVSDGQAEDSSFVVDEGCGVGSKGGHADVQHVVGLGRQVKGCGGERGLLMLPDVVKFTLNKTTQKKKDAIFKENTNITSLDSHKNVHNSLPSSSDL